jgi:hypothetical protein
MEMPLTMGLIGGWNLLQGESHICKLVQGGSVVPTEAASRQDCSECVQNVERGSAIQALKKHFKPGDIEELRGLEFHHHTQTTTEMIEQLGLSVQQLGRNLSSL